MLIQGPCHSKLGMFPTLGMEWRSSPCPGGTTQSGPVIESVRIAMSAMYTYMSVPRMAGQPCVRLPLLAHHADMWQLRHDTGPTHTAAPGAGAHAGAEGAMDKAVLHKAII